MPSLAYDVAPNEPPERQPSGTVHERESETVKDRAKRAKAPTGAAEAPTPAGTRRASTWTFLALVVTACAVCAFLKLPTLRYRADEMDERIYWQLAENLASGGPYSLQGTEILSRLSPAIYDHPVFHYPPLFPLLLVPFVLLGAKSAAVTVSWLGHILAVVAVAIVGRHAHRSMRPPSESLIVPAFWIPLLGVCADPLLFFVSRKLWIDSLLAGLLALSLALFVIAGTRRLVLLLLSGGFLGLAALAKLSALIVLPVYLVVLADRDLSLRARALALAAVLLPAALCIVPWSVFFYTRTGVFVPPWVAPDAWLMEHYPYIKAIVARPWYYYFLKVPLIAPLVAVVLYGVLRPAAGWPRRETHIAVAWFAVVLTATTAMGVAGYGFQMRQVAPAMPAVYVLAALLLSASERPVMLMASAFAILIGAVTAGAFLLVPGLDEIVSIVGVFGRSSF